MKYEAKSNRMNNESSYKNIVIGDNQCPINASNKSKPMGGMPKYV